MYKGVGLPDASCDSDEEIRKPAIPFEDDGKPIDETYAPTSGQDYLRRVHREAKRCPKVVVAEIPASKLRAITREIQADDKAPPTEGFQPSLDWQRERVAFFSNIRQQYALSKARFQNATSEWKKVESKEQWYTHIHTETLKPLTSVVANLSGEQVVKILEYHASWIREEFTSHRGQWIFAMLVALEKPLSPEVCDTIRNLARSASKTRTEIDQSRKTHLEELSLIVCLIARYFSQMDLCD